MFAWAADAAFGFCVVFSTSFSFLFRPRKFYFHHRDTSAIATSFPSALHLGAGFLLLFLENVRAPKQVLMLWHMAYLEWIWLLKCLDVCLLVGWLHRG